jgi:hypothetical protein
MGPPPAEEEPYYQYFTQSAGRQQGNLSKGQCNMISGEYNRSTAVNISQEQLYNRPVK